MTDDVTAPTPPAAATPEEPRRAPLAPGIRILRVLWRMVVPFAIAANIVGWTYLLDTSDDTKRQSWVIGLFILGFSLVASLIQEVLSPTNAELRMVKLKDHQAQRMMTIVKGLLFTLFGTQVAIWLVEANKWNPSLSALLSLLRNCGLIIFGWAAISRSWLIRSLRPAKINSYLDVVRMVLARVILPLGVVMALFLVIVHALGYEALAGWVSKHAMYTAVLILGAVLVHRWVRGRLHAAIAFMRDERMNEAAEAADVEGEGDGEEAPAPWWIGMERILAGALKIVVILGSLMILLRIWGLRLADLGPAMQQPILGGAGGQTWGGLVGSIVAAVVVYLSYTFLRNLLIFIVFPRTGVELGARYAMLTVLRYGAVVVIALLLLGAVGVNTSTLTVFAGGASVGLAFGMKDIFSNFFSGLIMLLERPVRVGDTVDVGGTRGKIEAVRLRGTTIRTYDGNTIIVPNTEMIGSRLTNLTHNFETARMVIEVGVSYDEDPRQVEEVLLKVARKDKRVNIDPEPVVRFTNFGGSSLDFRLIFWTDDLDDRWAMVSEMRTAIFEAFKKVDIEIPFPQMDLHVRSDARAEMHDRPELPSA